MSIFRRRASQDLPAQEATSSPGTEDLATEEAAPELSRRENGPFDESEVDGIGERLDLGAVWVQPIPGAEVRLEVDQASDTITSLQLVLGESAAQVQVFAAPRSGGVWREVRSEISEAITNAGGTVDEVEGALAPELHVRMPQLGPDGRQVLAPARFVGVDGPRWFLRAVLSGQAAINDEAASQALDALKGLVVVRGASPMAPREMLPLQLPQQASEPAEAQSPAADFNPFERGPEITEVR